MGKILFIVVFSFFTVSELFPQLQILTSVSEKKYNFSDVYDSIYGIVIYDKLNSFTGGDSIRNDKKGYAAQGWLEDYYENGNKLHKGFYVDGRLKVYKNFYENGQEERSFKSVTVKRAVMQVYFSNGKLKSNVEFLDGAAQKWEDYTADGKLEFVEEYDHSMEYLVQRKFYREDGSPRSVMALVDNRKKLYDMKEYYDNGNIKEEGQMKYNPGMMDYQKNGAWKFYDQSGKLLSEKKYSDGEVVSE